MGQENDKQREQQGYRPYSGSMLAELQGSVCGWRGVSKGVGVDRAVRAPWVTVRTLLF